jgi:outer membrane protein TolC
MKTPSLIVMTALLGAGAAHAADSAPLGLGAVFQASVAHSEHLGEAAAGLSRAAAQSDESVGNWLPQLVLRSRENLYDGSGGLQSPSLALNIREDLIKGLDEVAALKASEPLQAKAQADLAKARQDLAREVAGDYFDVLSLEEQVALESSAHANAVTATADLRRRVNLGRNRRSELSEQEAQTARVAASLAVLQSKLEEARLGLASLTGLPVDQALAQPEPVSPAAAAVMAEAPAVSSAEQALKLAEAKHLAAQGGYWPSLFAEANAYATHQDGVSAPAWDLQMGVDLPLFRFGAQRARVRQSEADLEVARLERDLAVRGARRESDQAQAALGLALARVNASQQALDAAEKSYADQKRDFDDSLITSLDLTRAFDAVESARLDASSARWDAQRAALRVRLALGATEP